MTPAPERRVGVFGGTFDPPHLGHLIMAQDAMDSLGLDEIFWVPARQSPFKEAGESSDSSSRAALVRAAIAGRSGFRVWEGELERPGPSYTVDTVRAFRETFPDAQLYLLMGADQWDRFHAWKDPEEITRLARVGVFARSLGEGEYHSAGTAAGVVGGESTGGSRSFPFETIPARRLDISSTEVRERVRQGRSIRYLVTPEVETAIRQLRLYD